MAKPFHKLVSLTSTPLLFSSTTRRSTAQTSGVTWMQGVSRSKGS
jgi:hypothetical protein